MEKHEGEIPNPFYDAVIFVTGTDDQSRLAILRTLKETPGKEDFQQIKAGLEAGLALLN